MGGAFNVAEVLKQLGLKGVQDLPLLHAIQPTIDVGDASGLAPTMLAPTAWGGGSIGAAVNEYTGCQVHALGVGGTWIRFLTMQSANNPSGFVWSIADADPLAANPMTAFPYPLLDMAPEPIRSLLYADTSTVQLATDLPTWRAPTHGAVPMVDFVYLQHGQWFTCQCNAFQQGLWFQICVQDVPAAALSPTG